MKLKKLLKDTEVHIIYRTNGQTEKDMLIGGCTWTGKELIPDDNESYSVEDEINRYAWTSDKDLTVWYKSSWITG